MRRFRRLLSGLLSVARLGSWLVAPQLRVFGVSAPACGMVPVQREPRICVSFGYCLRAAMLLLAVGLWCGTATAAKQLPGAQDSGPPQRLQVSRSETLSDEDRIDRYVALEPYCTALNMSFYSCERLSKIVFSRAASAGDSLPLRWSVDSSAGSPDGGFDTSVVSRQVGSGDYNCMSLHFDPPIQSGWEVIFDWDIGHEEGDGRPFLRFYQYAPGDGDDQVPIDADGEFATSNAFRWLESGAASGFEGWRTVSRRLSEEVGELRWCYFGAYATAGAEDIGRVDRLVLSSTSHTFTRSADANRIGEYCAALGLADPLCERLSQISFARTGTGDPVWGFTYIFNSMPVSPGEGSEAVPGRVSRDEYSCISLHWDPPLLPRDRLTAETRLLRSRPTTARSRLRAWVEPGADHVPQYEGPGFVEYEFVPDIQANGQTYPDNPMETGNGGSASLVLPVTQVSREFKLCYFGVVDDPLIMVADFSQSDVAGFTLMGYSGGGLQLIADRLALCDALDIAACDDIVLPEGLLEPGLNWFRSTDRPVAGDSALESGVTTDESGRLCLELSPVNPPVALSVKFSWRIDAVLGDRLNFYAGDRLVAGIAGDRPWREESYLLNFGAPGALRWCYEQSDEEVAQTERRAWLDGLRLQPALDRCRQLVGEGCDFLDRVIIGSFSSPVIEWQFLNLSERGPILRGRPVIPSQREVLDGVDLEFSEAFHAEYLLYGFSLDYQNLRNIESLSGMLVSLSYFDSAAGPVTDSPVVQAVPQDERWQYFEYPLEFGRELVSGVLLRYNFPDGVQLGPVYQLNLSDIRLLAVPRQSSSATAFCAVAMAGGATGSSCAQLAPVDVFSGVQPFVPADRPWRVMAGESGNGEALFSPAAAFHPQADYRRPVCLRVPVVGPRVLSALSFRYRLSGQSSASVLASAPGAEAVELARLPISPDWSSFAPGLDQQQRFSEFWLCHHRDWLNPQHVTDVFGIDEIAVQTTLPDLCRAGSAPAMTDRCLWPNAAAGISSAVSVVFEPLTRPWRLGAGREADDGALYSPLGTEPSCLRLEPAAGERLRRVSFFYRFGEVVDVGPLRIELQTPSARHSLAMLTPIADWSSFEHTFSDPYRGPRVSAVLLCYQRRNLWRESDTVAVTEPGLETAAAVQSVAGLALTPAFAFRQTDSGPPRLYSAAWPDGSGRLHLGIELRLLDRYGNQVRGSSYTASLRVRHRDSNRALSLDVAGGSERQSATGELVQPALQIGASGSLFADIGIEPGMAVDTTVLVEVNGPPGLSALREYRLLDICELSLAGGAAGSACREFGDTVLAADNDGAERPWEWRSGEGSSGDYLQSPVVSDDVGSCLRLRIAGDRQLRGLSFRYRMTAQISDDRLNLVTLRYFRIFARLPGEESRRQLADLPIVSDWTSFAHRSEVILPAASDILLCYREVGSFVNYRYRVGVDDLALEPLSVAEDFCAELLVGGGDGADCETLNTAALSFEPADRPWHFAAIELTEGLALRQLAGGEGGLSCLRLPVAGGRLLRAFSFRYRLEPESSPAALIVRLGRGDGPEERVAELPALGWWRDFRYRVAPFGSPPRAVSLCYREPDGSAAGAGMAALDRLQLQSLDIVEDFCKLAVRGGAAGPNCAVLGPADRSVPRVEFDGSGSDWALISGDQPGQFAVYSSRQSCLRLIIGAEWQLQRIGFRYRQGTADGDNMDLRLVGGLNSTIRLGRAGEPAGDWVDVARTVGARLGRVSELSLCYRGGGDDVAEAARAAVTALVLEARPLAPDVSGGLEDFCDRLVVGGRDGPSCAALSPLDSEGSVAAFEPPERPWRYREDGSRGVVLQSGMLGDGERSCVRLRVRADRQLHGFSLAYRHSVEEYYDFLVIYADRGLGDRWEVGRFSGEAPWTNYAVQVPPRRGPLSGISLCYERDGQGGGGNDLVAIDSLALQTMAVGVTEPGRSLYLRAPLRVLQLGSRPVEVPVLLSVLDVSGRYDYGELANVAVELEGLAGEFARLGLDLGGNRRSGTGSSVRLTGLTVSALSFSLAAQLLLADGQAEASATVEISGGAEVHGSRLEFRVVEFCTLAVAGGRAGDACTALSAVVESAVVEPSPEGLWRSSRVSAGGERDALLAFAQDDGDAYESCLRLRLSAQHVLSELSFDYRIPPAGAGLFLRLLGPAVTDVRELPLAPTDGASWRSFTYAPAADLAGLRELAWCYYRDDAVFGEQAAAGLSELRLSGHSRGAQADFCELAVRGGRSGAGCQSLRLLEATGSRVEYRPQSRPWRAGTAETGEALLLSDGLAAGESSCLRLRLTAGLVLLDIGFRYRVMAAGDGGLRLYWLRDGVAESSVPVRSLSASAWTDVMVATTPQPRVVVGIALCHEGGSGGTGAAWLDDVYLATGAPESQPRQPGLLTVLGPPRVFALGSGRPAEFNFRVEVMDTVGRAFIGELPEQLWLDVSAVAAETALSLRVLGSEEQQGVGRVVLRDLGLGPYGELSSLLTVALPAGLEGTTVAVRVGGLSGVEEYELALGVSDFCAVALSADADCEEFAAVVGALSFSAERSPWAVAAAGREGSALYASSSPGGEQRNCLRLHVLEPGRLSGLGFDYRTLPGAGDGGSLSLSLRFSGGAEDLVAALFPGSADWETAEYALDSSVEVPESLALCYHGAADESAAVAGLLLDNLALELNVLVPESPPRSADALQDFCDIAVLGGRDGSVCRLLQPLDYRGNRVEYMPRTLPWRVVPAEDPSALALANGRAPGCMRLRLRPAERLLGFSFRYSLSSRALSTTEDCERLGGRAASCSELGVFVHEQPDDQQRFLTGLAETSSGTWRLWSHRLDPEFAVADGFSLCIMDFAVEFAVDDIQLLVVPAGPAVPAALRLHGPARVFNSAIPQSFGVRVELLDALGNRMSVPDALELELWVAESGGSRLSLAMAAADVEFGTELLWRRLNTAAPFGFVDLLLSAELYPGLLATTVTVTASAAVPAGKRIEASIDIPIIDFCALALAHSSVAPLCAAIGEIAFDPPDSPWRVVGDGMLRSAIAVDEGQRSCLQLRFLPRAVQGPTILTPLYPIDARGHRLIGTDHSVLTRHEYEDRLGRAGAVVLSEVQPFPDAIRPGYEGPYTGNQLTEFVRSFSLCHRGGAEAGRRKFVQIAGLRAVTRYNVFPPAGQQYYQESASGQGSGEASVTGRRPILQLLRTPAELIFSGNLALGRGNSVSPAMINIHEFGLRFSSSSALDGLLNIGISPLGLPAVLQSAGAVQFGIRVGGLKRLSGKPFFIFTMTPDGAGRSLKMLMVGRSTATQIISQNARFEIPLSAGVDSVDLLFSADLGGGAIGRFTLNARAAFSDLQLGELSNSVDFVVVDICALLGRDYPRDRQALCAGFRDLADLHMEPAGRQPWQALHPCDGDNLDRCFERGLYSPPTPDGGQSCLLLKVAEEKVIERFSAALRISSEAQLPGFKTGDVLIVSLFREDAPQTPVPVFFMSGQPRHDFWGYSAADDSPRAPRVIGLSFCYRKDGSGTEFDDFAGIGNVRFETADAPGRRLYLQGPTLLFRIRGQEPARLDLRVGLLPAAAKVSEDIQIQFELSVGGADSSLTATAAGISVASIDGSALLQGLSLPVSGSLPVRVLVHDFGGDNTTATLAVNAMAQLANSTPDSLNILLADFCSVAVLDGSEGEACGESLGLVERIVAGSGRSPWRVMDSTAPGGGLALFGPDKMRRGQRSCLRFELRPVSGLLTGFRFRYRFGITGKGGDFAVLLERDRLGELSEELLLSVATETDWSIFVHTVDLSRGPPAAILLCYRLLRHDLGADLAPADVVEMDDIRLYSELSTDFTGDGRTDHRDLLPVLRWLARCNAISPTSCSLDQGGFAELLGNLSAASDETLASRMQAFRRLLSSADRGYYDSDGDRRLSYRDIRLLLRRLAGLRGEALGAERPELSTP